MKPIPFNAYAWALLLPLTACGQASQTDSQSRSATPAAQSASAGAAPSPSMISREVGKAMEKAKQELATSNIDVDSVHVGHGRRHTSSQPKAQITPQGDLLIAGDKVTATPAQHVLLLDYRQQIIGIAEAGMDIGTQGADLGMSAARQALWGALSGKSDKDVEASIKPQTDKLEAAAMTLCKRLPDLLSSQQKLAAAMPAFRPYATMEQQDIDDCGKETGRKGITVSD